MATEENVKTSQTPLYAYMLDDQNQDKQNNEVVYLST